MRPNEGAEVGLAAWMAKELAAQRGNIERYDADARLCALVLAQDAWLRGQPGLEHYPEDEGATADLVQRRMVAAERGPFVCEVA